MAASRIRTFTVLPRLPERLQALHKLAYNLWWCWHHEAVFLFRRLDPDLFEAVEHSPVKLLGAIDQARLEQLHRAALEANGSERSGFVVFALQDVATVCTAERLLELSARPLGGEPHQRVRLLSPAAPGMAA